MQILNYTVYEILFKHTSDLVHLEESMTFIYVEHVVLKLIKSLKDDLLLVRAGEGVGLIILKNYESDSGLKLAEHFFL